MRGGSAGRGNPARQEPSPEARPGAGKTPQWSAERRPRIARCAARMKSDAPFGAPLPRHLAERKEMDDGVPRAAKNRGDDARLLYPSPFRGGIGRAERDAL